MKGKKKDNGILGRQKMFKHQGNKLQSRGQIYSVMQSMDARFIFLGREF